ncbi:Protein CBG26187 [Caenorhabditis briggsae]|uniref:Protein CBG26187 n=1 Tax=Caenorhabditis briggsae TaxID=6238 RepID=B6ILT2_CAEBR|nr:Protein CBG26187 [Caenorhabditis briggsae]CAS00862.1 Protein CBG26187 [Caenorhabditis briggsae]
MLLALTRHKDERLEGLEAENENLVSEVVELKAMIHKQRAQVEIAEKIVSEDELKFVQREKEALQKAKDEEIAELMEKLQEEAAGAVDTENGAKKVPGGVKEDSDAESGKAAKTEENEIKEEEGNIDGLKIKADGEGGKEENAKIEDDVPEGDKAAELKAEKAKVDCVDAEDKKVSTEDLFV